MQTADSARPDTAEGEAPRVSVVLPAYNRQQYIGPTIESVIAQTLERWELVVYDDGSTDGTLDVANSYRQRGPAGAGPPRARTGASP